MQKVIDIIINSRGEYENATEKGINLILEEGWVVKDVKCTPFEKEEGCSSKILMTYVLEKCIYTDKQAAPNEAQDFLNREIDKIFG